MLMDEFSVGSEMEFIAHFFGYEKAVSVSKSMMIMISFHLTDIVSSVVEVCFQQCHRPCR